MNSFKLVRTDTAKMAMSSYWIVEIIDLFGQIKLGGFPVSIDALLVRSFFKLLKKDFATALSQQFPRLLMR